MLTQTPDAIDRLGVVTPIFGFSHCRDVVVAVSKAGGLGVYGAALHSDAQIAIDLDWIEAQLGGLPYGIDLLMPSKYVGNDSGGLSAAEAQAAIPSEVTAFLDDMMVRYDVPDVETAEYPPDDDFLALGGQRYSAKQAEGILDLAFARSPKLLVSALGSPSSELVENSRYRRSLTTSRTSRLSATGLLHSRQSGRPPSEGENTRQLVRAARR